MATFALTETISDADSQADGGGGDTTGDTIDARRDNAGKKEGWGCRWEIDETEVGTISSAKVVNKYYAQSSTDTFLGDYKIIPNANDFDTTTNNPGNQFSGATGVTAYTWDLVAGQADSPDISTALEEAIDLLSFDGNGKGYLNIIWMPDSQTPAATRQYYSREHALGGSELTYDYVNPDGSVTPSVIQSTTAFPATTLAGGGTVTPSVLQSTAAFPAPTLVWDGVVTPEVLAATTTLPVATPVSPGSVTPDELSATTSLPTATPTATGGESGFVTPDALDSTTTFPATKLWNKATFIHTTYLYVDLYTDLYMPMGTPPSDGWKTVIFVHGGRFIVGSRVIGGGENYLSEVWLDHLLANDYAVASVDYRWSKERALDRDCDGPTMPLAIKDVKELSQYLEANGSSATGGDDTYPVDSDNLIIAAHSAGAHIAIMAALTVGDTTTYTGRENENTYNLLFNPNNLGRNGWRGGTWGAANSWTYKYNYRAWGGSATSPDWADNDGPDCKPFVGAFLYAPIWNLDGTQNLNSPFNIMAFRSYVGIDANVGSASIGSVMQEEGDPGDYCSPAAANSVHYTARGAQTKRLPNVRGPNGVALALAVAYSAGDIIVSPTYGVTPLAQLYTDESMEQSTVKQMTAADTAILSASDVETGGLTKIALPAATGHANILFDSAPEDFVTWADEVFAAGEVASTGIQATTAFPATTLIGDGVVTPEALNATASFPATTFAVGGVVTPDSLDATSTFPATSFTTDSGVTPDALSATSTFPATTLAGGGSVTHDALDVAVSFPATTTAGGGEVDLTAPGMAASFQSAGTTGDGEVDLTALGVAVSFQAASTAGDGALTVAAFGIVTSFPAVTLAGDGVVTPDALDAATSFPTSITVGGGALTATVLGSTASFPAATAGSIDKLVSDDFFDSTLDSMWTTVDPNGDGTVSLVGSGTSNARLSIAVPAAANHDAGQTNESVRVLQSISDGDFEVEAKFDSVPISVFQEQGIQVVEDSDNWFRFEFHYGISGQRVYIAKNVGGSWTVVHDAEPTSSISGEVWLKVDRSGDDWTFYVSDDGSSWDTEDTFTQSMTIAEVGPYVGNFGSPESSAPAYTALVDYVFNTDSPINLEDQRPKISVTTTFPSATLAGDGVVIPEVLAATTTLPEATVPSTSGDGAVTPDTLASTTAFPAVSPAGSTVLVASVFTPSVTFQAVTPVGGGQADTSVMTPSVGFSAASSTGDGQVDASTLIPSVSFQTATSGGGGQVGTSTFAPSVSFPATTSEGDGLVTAAVISPEVTFPATTLAGDGVLTAIVLEVATTLPEASVGGDSILVATLLELGAAFPATTLVGDGEADVSSTSFVPVFTDPIVDGAGQVNASPGAFTTAFVSPTTTGDGEVAAASSTITTTFVDPSVDGGGAVSALALTLAPVFTDPSVVGHGEMDVSTLVLAPSITDPVTTGDNEVAAPILGVSVQLPSAKATGGSSAGVLSTAIEVPSASGFGAGEVTATTLSIVVDLPGAAALGGGASVASSVVPEVLFPEVSTSGAGQEAAQSVEITVQFPTVTTSAAPPEDSSVSAAPLTLAVVTPQVTPIGGGVTQAGPLVVSVDLTTLVNDGSMSAASAEIVPNFFDPTTAGDGGVLAQLIALQVTMTLSTANEITRTDPVIIEIEVDLEPMIEVAFGSVWPIDIPLDL